MECPIKCGKCCYGTDVAYTEPYPVDDWEPCPNLKKKIGCKLPREQRPEICNSYLCDVAKSKI